MKRLTALFLLLLVAETYGARNEQRAAETQLG